MIYQEALYPLTSGCKAFLIFCAFDAVWVSLADDLIFTLLLSFPPSRYLAAAYIGHAGSVSD
jgi:hypothetical protein